MHVYIKATNNPPNLNKASKSLKDRVKAATLIIPTFANSSRCSMFIFTLDNLSFMK